jgi:hypothetical protein
MWASLQASVFDADAVMGGTDVEAKMSAVSRLQSLLEDMQVALMREDEEE